MSGLWQDRVQDEGSAETSAERGRRGRIGTRGEILPAQPVTRC